MCSMLDTDCLPKQSALREKPHHHYLAAGTLPAQQHRLGRLM